MKKQLQGISLVLLGILLTIAFGNMPFFDLDFGWSVIFAILGIAGVIMVFSPDKKN